MRWANFLKSQKNKWFAPRGKGWDSYGGRQVSGQLWGKILAYPLLYSFPLLPLETKGTLLGFPASIFPDYDVGKTGTFNHKISGSHLHPHSIPKSGF
jgi:hypothetical protein